MVVLVDSLKRCMHCFDIILTNFVFSVGGVKPVVLQNMFLVLAMWSIQSVVKVALLVCCGEEKVEIGASENNNSAQRGSTQA